MKETSTCSCSSHMYTVLHAPAWYSSQIVLYISNVSLGGVQDDAIVLGAQFSRLQAGLVMLATYRAQHVVDSMESWRKIRTRDLYHRGLELHTIKKSLVAVCSPCQANPLFCRAAPPDQRNTGPKLPTNSSSKIWTTFLY